MARPLPCPILNDGDFSPDTAELQAELWRDCQTWAGRVLEFVTKNRPDSKLSAAQVAAIIILLPERFAGMSLEKISARVEIEAAEIEAAIRRVRGELFGRVRHPARATVRP